ncbi:MAG TPA: hypothetical protein VE753_08335 [Gaiellaceae bacterium]|nr:hypothetical protein [Gaiellaceae bacterium]
MLTATALAATAVALALGVLAMDAAADPPGPLPPEQARAQGDGAVRHGENVIAREVPLSEAAAAAARPGAVTEGAVPSARSPVAVAADPCWSITGLWTEWGTWPYQQRVTEDRYWCAYSWGGTQYYRSSTVRLGSTLCSHNSGWQERISGGNGYTWTVVRTGGSFSCATTIPWITLHYDRWQDWSCNTWGNCAWVRSS